MTKIFATLILSLITTFISAQTWQLETPIKSTSAIKDVFMVNASTGYVVENALGGQLLKTEDGGLNYKRVGGSFVSPPNALWMFNDSVGLLNSDFRCYKTTNGLITDAGIETYIQGSTAMRFVNRNVGFVTAANGKLYKTINGGQTWVLSTTNTTADLMSLNFLNDSVGFVATNSGKILKTTNVGATWQILNTGYNYQFFDVLFTSPSIGVAVGGIGDMYRTVDGGTTWTAMRPTTKNIYKLFFVNQTLIATCDAGIVLRSTDEGATWTSAVYGNKPFYSIHINQLGVGLMGGEGCIYKTTDFGATWQVSKIGTPHSYLNKVSFANDSVGISVGYATLGGIYAAVYKTKDGGKTWTATYGGGLGVHLNPNGSGAIGGGSGAFAKTTNFGQTFDGGLGLGPSVAIRTVWAQNDSSYIVGGGYVNGGIYRTTNTGRTWTYSMGGTMTDLHFPSDSVGYSVGQNGEVMKTRDGGKTWANLTQISTSEMYSVFFVNDTIGYQAGLSNSFKTTNGGATWTSNGLSNICAIHFYSIDTGYAVSRSGYVLKTTNGGNTWSNFLIWNSNEAFNDAAFLKDRIVSVGTSGDVHTTFLNCNYATTLLPTILQSGKTLYANYTVGNQWFRDNNPIVGATGSAFTPTVSGNYHVVNTNNSGCKTKPSSKISVVINSNSATVETPLKVYPNPTNAQITVDIPTELSSETLHVFNTLGQIVFSKKINNATTITLDVSPFVKGFYILTIGHKMAKIMKQ
jgi:photosystem II stability/assembly factor-like uncharacterized protein